MDASCLRIQEGCSSTILHPNPAYTPKNITSSIRWRVVALDGFFPPPHKTEEEVTSHLLCPVRALSFYVANTAALHHSQSLFVHYREQSQELPLSAQRLTHWLSGSIISPKGWIPRENLSPFHQRNFFPCTEE